MYVRTTTGKTVWIVEKRANGPLSELLIDTEGNAWTAVGSALQVAPAPRPAETDEEPVEAPVEEPTEEDIARFEITEVPPTETETQPAPAADETPGDDGAAGADVDSAASDPALD